MDQTMNGNTLELMTRRELLAAGATAALGTLQAKENSRPAAPLLMPGPCRGTVIEIGHPGSVERHKVNRDAVRKMMSRGMKELAGAPDESSAWKRFFKPHEIVGIKVSPVGKPIAISQPETILEVIRGLNLAGVKNENIIVFNRYEGEYHDAGFDKIVPAGV